tara:strand:- start:18770 stop:19048 length:279 start_codon:yes stop_codon:yes gene_type:complete
MTENDNQTEPTAYEKFQANIQRAKESAERITNKALEDRSLIEEMDLELEELASELEGKESKLFGTQEEIEEVETRLDEDPNSPTYNQHIPVA